MRIGRAAEIDAIHVFPADPTSLARIRALVRHVGAAAGLAPEAVDDLVLAVSEAASNSILHSGGSTVRLRWSSDRGCVDVWVADDGMFAAAADRHGNDHGRGIELMVAVMDQVSIQEGTRRRPGTAVRLVKCRDVPNGRPGDGSA